MVGPGAWACYRQFGRCQCAAPGIWNAVEHPGCEHAHLMPCTRRLYAAGTSTNLVVTGAFDQRILDPKRCVPCWSYRSKHGAMPAAQMVADCSLCWKALCPETPIFGCSEYYQPGATPIQLFGVAPYGAIVVRVGQHCAMCYALHPLLPASAALLQALPRVGLSACSSPKPGPYVKVSQTPSGASTTSSWPRPSSSPAALA